MLMFIHLVFYKNVFNFKIALHVYCYSLKKYLKIGFNTIYDSQWIIT